MTCQQCKESKCTYNMTCQDCRTRLAMNFFCKVLRKQMVEANEKWGETKDWQKEPHCGCKDYCVMKRRIKLDDYPLPTKTTNKSNRKRN